MPQHDFSQLRDFNNKAAQYLVSMCQFNTKMKLETFQQFALTGLVWGIYLKLETFLIASNSNACQIFDKRIGDGEPGDKEEPGGGAASERHSPSSTLWMRRRTRSQEWLLSIFIH